MTPPRLTTLRVNFSREVLRPCSFSVLKNKKGFGKEKIQEKNLQPSEVCVLTMLSMLEKPKKNYEMQTVNCKCEL